MNSNYYGMARRQGQSTRDTAMQALLGILERLRLCRAPRIISARCLTDDPGIVRNEA